MPQPSYLVAYDRRQKYVEFLEWTSVRHGTPTTSKGQGVTTTTTMTMMMMMMMMMMINHVTATLPSRHTLCRDTETPSSQRNLTQDPIVAARTTVNPTNLSTGVSSAHVD